MMLQKYFLRTTVCLTMVLFCVSSRAQKMDIIMHEVDDMYNKKKEQFVYGDEDYGILLTQYNKGKKATLVMLEPYRDGESSGTRIARIWYKGELSSTFFYVPEIMRPDYRVYIRMDYKNIAIHIDEWEENTNRLTLAYEKLNNFTPGELDYAIFVDRSNSSFVLSSCKESTGKNCHPDFAVASWNKDYGYFSGVFEINKFQDKEYAGYTAVGNYKKSYGIFADGGEGLNALYYKDHPSRGDEVLIGEFNYFTDSEPFYDYFLLKEEQAYMVFLDDDYKEMERVNITKYVNESLPLGK